MITKQNAFAALACSFLFCLQLNAAAAWFCFEGRKPKPKKTESLLPPLSYDAMETELYEKGRRLNDYNNSHCEHSAQITHQMLSLLDRCEPEYQSQSEEIELRRNYLIGTLENRRPSGHCTPGNCAFLALHYRRT